MKLRTFRWAIFLSLLSAGALWWWASRTTPEEPAPDGSKSAATAVSDSASAKADTPSSASTPPTAERIEDIRARLLAATTPEASRKILAELRALLDALPPHVASREVQAFLALNQDAGTRLDVTIQKGGKLGDSSSLRVFLLDYLGQIDGPAAATVGRIVLATPTSPDEWAVSMRNVAWAEDTPATRGYLQGKVREMIANPAWSQKPTAGFLEAFDVIVHTRAYELTPQLSEFVRNKDRRDLGHAAYLTLDRLILTDPATALTPLAEQPDLMAGREQTRANFFARLDVRDSAQKALLEKYLLDERRTAQELQTFAGIFPSANYMVSNNLLTPTITPDRTELTARDRASLDLVNAWLSDARFVQRKTHIEAIKSRLSAFVQQAAAPARSP